MIEPGRLKELRSGQKLTQGGLASKAGLNKQTIYRLERGPRRAIRKGNVEKLCKALGVSPEVLSGQAELPGTEPLRPSDNSSYQINVRLKGATRNAFSLAVMRYRVPVARIIELAPYLFVLAAEASLTQRRANLAELRELSERERALGSNFPHLPPIVGSSDYREETALRAEEESIKARDILAAKLPDSIFEDFDQDYDERENNPFVQYLKKAASIGEDVASIDRFSRHSTDFSVCRDDAVKLAGGDHGLADGIVQGWVMLNEMPRELRSDRGAEARIAWLREKMETYLAAIPDIESLEHMPEAGTI